MKLFRRDGIQGINNNIIESPAPLIESTYNIHLFGLNRGGFSKDRFFGRIYGFKVYDKGELVQSLVPAWDDNGIVCMFDEVNNKYLYNQGTGDFLYADISDKITPVKYIESTGTQWVNTNYVHTDKTKLDWTVMITSDNINFVPLGARQKADENSTSQFIMWFKNQSELTAQIGSTNMEHKLFWSGHKLNWVASPTESIITDEDGTVYRNSSTSTIVSGNTYPLYIGGANYGNASCRCIAQRFYGLKIYEGPLVWPCWA